MQCNLTKLAMNVNKKGKYSFQTQIINLTNGKAGMPCQFTLAISQHRSHLISPHHNNMVLVYTHLLVDTFVESGHEDRSLLYAAPIFYGQHSPLKLEHVSEIRDNISST